MPPIAGFYHRANMESVAKQAFEAAGLSMADIDVVAATVKPGGHCFSLPQSWCRLYFDPTFNLRLNLLFISLRIIAIIRSWGKVWLLPE